MVTKSLSKHIEILLIEDSPADILLTREAFEESRILNTLHVAEDGVQAMDFLRKRGAYASAPRPDLILLDLNMPRKDGRKALAEIKSELALQHIPVVILTTSEDQKDIAFAMETRAESFITKPATFDEWVQIMRSLAKNWLS